MKTKLVINLIGAPGSGKSTTAAGLFYELKMRGFDVELVLEYAKDLVWSEHFKTLANQIYVFGKQHHRMYRLQDKVDFIITDSPLLLSIYYANVNSVGSPAFRELVLEEFHKYDNLNIFLNRVKAYNPNGRLQNEKESDQVAKELKELLYDTGIEYLEMDGNKDAVDKIMSAVCTLKFFNN